MGKTFTRKENEAEEEKKNKNRGTTQTRQERGFKFHLMILLTTEATQPDPICRREHFPP